MKKFFILLTAALLTVACGNNKTKQAAQASQDDTEQERGAKDMRGADKSAQANEKPQEDVFYIHRESGDKWLFGLELSYDGTKAYHMAYFRANGMQDYERFKVNSKGDSRYTMHKTRTEESEDLQLLVYPGADSIQVTHPDGQSRVFKTAESFDEAVSSIDPDYTPERYAITAGENGGKWEPMESGETAYVFPNGTYARSVWVKDGGRLYYVDVSGCRMLNNYAHDGFYAGADGSWDKKVKCIDDNELPAKQKVYSDDSKVEWTFNLTDHSDGTIDGTARHVYPEPMNHITNYRVKSFGHSTYALYNVNDDFEKWHVCVLDHGKTIRVSGAGTTDVFRLQK